MKTKIIDNWEVELTNDSGDTLTLKGEWYADFFKEYENKQSESTEPAIVGNTVLSAGWIPVEKQLPEFGKPVLILTDYGKMDVCRLRLEDNRVIVWVNDMRPQHTNGSVIAWIALPACR